MMRKKGKLADYKTEERPDGLFDLILSKEGQGKERICLTLAGYQLEYIFSKFGKDCNVSEIVRKMIDDRIILDIKEEGEIIIGGQTFTLIPLKSES
jgi:hypothetical protein